MPPRRKRGAQRSSQVQAPTLAAVQSQQSSAQATAQTYSLWVALSAAEQCKLLEFAIPELLQRTADVRDASVHGDEEELLDLLHNELQGASSNREDFREAELAFLRGMEAGRHAVCQMRPTGTPDQEGYHVGLQMSIHMAMRLFLKTNKLLHQFVLGPAVQFVVAKLPLGHPGRSDVNAHLADISTADLQRLLAWLLKQMKALAVDLTQQDEATGGEAWQTLFRMEGSESIRLDLSNLAMRHCTMLQGAAAKSAVPASITAVDAAGLRAIHELPGLSASLCAAAAPAWLGGHEPSLEYAAAQLPDALQQLHELCDLVAEGQRLLEDCGALRKSVRALWPYGQSWSDASEHSLLQAVKTVILHEGALYKAMCFASSRQASIGDKATKECWALLQKFKTPAMARLTSATADWGAVGESGPCNATLAFTMFADKTLQSVQDDYADLEMSTAASKRLVVAAQSRLVTLATWDSMLNIPASDFEAQHAVLVAQMQGKMQQDPAVGPYAAEALELVQGIISQEELHRQVKEGAIMRSRPVQERDIIKGIKVMNQLHQQQLNSAHVAVRHLRRRLLHIAYDDPEPLLLRELVLPALQERLAAAAAKVARQEAAKLLAAGVQEREKAEQAKLKKQKKKLRRATQHQEQQQQEQGRTVEPAPPAADAQHGFSPEGAAPALPCAAAAEPADTATSTSSADPASEVIRSALQSLQSASTLPAEAACSGGSELITSASQPLQAASTPAAEAARTRDIEGTNSTSQPLQTADAAAALSECGSAAFSEMDALAELMGHLMPPPAITALGTNQTPAGDASIEGPTSAAEQEHGRQQTLPTSEQRQHDTQQGLPAGQLKLSDEPGASSADHHQQQEGQQRTAAGSQAAWPAGEAIEERAVQAAGSRANMAVSLAEIFCCPITQEIMADPVVCADGHTYERQAITHWLVQHNTSPMTNETLLHKHLAPNRALRSAIQCLPAA